MNGGGRTHQPHLCSRCRLLECRILCGADRDRTDDLRLAKPALSQLSYSPSGVARAAEERVGQGRVELPTSRLSGVRSNHLSYWPSQVTACAVLGPLPGGEVVQADFGCFRGCSEPREVAALAPWKLNRTLARQWVLTSRPCSGASEDALESEDSLERR